MRLGLIARADARGLGHLTREFYRHMHPAATLVVDMQARSPYPLHLEWYDNPLVTTYERPQWSVIADFLDRVDVIYTAETPYWYELYDWARARGIRTVCHVMPEFYVHNDPSYPRPDALWIPTKWLADRIPDATLVPVPVARDRLPYRQRVEARRFLHPGGHPAANDRNGTLAVIAAGRRLRHVDRIDCELQSGHLYRSSHCAFTVGRPGEYWEPFHQADVVVLPRRYGGLSLPMQEAASAGCIVVATGVEPQSEWLPAECQIRSSRTRKMRTTSGPIDIYQPSPADLAEKLDRLAREPDLVARLSTQMDRYADTLDWQAWAPRYRQLLEQL